MVGAGPIVSPRMQDTRAFRDTIGHLVTGVCVVTALGPDGPAGLTTNAVSSLSLRPPLIVVCFDNTSRTLPVVRAAGRFGVNVLHTGQERLARRFASKRIAAEKFAAVTHSVDHGVPVLDDALAWLACDLEAEHPGGDHTIGVGAVTAMGHGEGDPLAFYRGRYVTTS